MAGLSIRSNSVMAQPRPTAPATIEGGADASGRSYHWTVINQSGAAIVDISFPIYRVTTFQGPPGWESNCEPDPASPDSQVCRARAPMASAGIQPGGRSTFTAQVAASGIVRGRGEVTIRVAGHGEPVKVNAELPLREPLGDRYTSLIGLGVVFACFLGFRWIRSRRIEPAAALRS